jgi:hypothetical protein
MGFLGFGGDKTTTSTQTIGSEDQDYMRRQREAGAAAAEAATQGPWTADPSARWGNYASQSNNAFRQYGDLMGQFGGMGQQAMGNAMGMGLSGLGSYMNPMFDQWMQATNPAYQQSLAEAGNQARVGTTLPGASAMQSTRSGVVEGQMLGDVNNARMGQIGNMQAQMASQAANMLMQDRARMGDLGMNLYNQSMAAGDRQRQAQGDILTQEEHARRLREQALQDPYRQRSAAAAEYKNAFGAPMETTQTDVQEGGGWFQDFLGAALPIAGMALGPAGAMGGGFLSNMFGGGGPQITSAMAQATQPTSVMPPVNTWG